MLKLTLVFSILMTAFAHASITIKAKIHDIDFGTPDEKTLIFLSTGQVVTLNKSQDVNLEREQWFSIIVNEKQEVLGIKRIEALETQNKSDERPLILSDEVYAPTILEDMAIATTYFKEARYNPRESQCYNRAHVWTHEWFINHNVNSNKTWIFFTRKYIRKYKFKWWFHVAPSVMVSENDAIKEKVMDVKYARGPLDLKRWTDIFMLNDASCPVVKTYSDYANYPESTWCFVMRSSMFYYQPFDLEVKESYETIKGNWFYAELKQAYFDALEEVLEEKK